MIYMYRSRYIIIFMHVMMRAKILGKQPECDLKI